jgi:hypothetical protein
VCPSRMHPPRRRREAPKRLSPRLKLDTKLSQDAHDVIIVDDDSDVEDKRPPTDDILDDALTIKSEGPLSAVTEESVLDDAPTSTHVKSEAPPD